MNNIISDEDLQALNEEVGSSVVVIDTTGPYSTFSDLPSWFRQFVVNETVDAPYISADTESRPHSTIFKDGELVMNHTIGYIPKENKYIRIFGRPLSDNFTTLGDISKNRAKMRAFDLQTPGYDGGYDMNNKSLKKMFANAEDVMKFLFKVQTKKCDEFFTSDIKKYKCFEQPTYITESHICHDIDTEYTHMVPEDFIKRSPRDQLRFKLLKKDKAIEVTDVFLDIVTTLDNMFHETAFEIDEDTHNTYKIICEYKDFRNKYNGMRTKVFEEYGLGMSVNNLLPNKFSKKVDSEGNIIDWKWNDWYDVRARPPSLFWEFNTMEFDFSKLDLSLLEPNNIRKYKCFIDSGMDSICAINVDNTVITL